MNDLKIELIKEFVKNNADNFKNCVVTFYHEKIVILATK